MVLFLDTEKCPQLNNIDFKFPAMKIGTFLLLAIAYCSFGQASTCYYKGVVQDSATGKNVITLSRSGNSVVYFLDQYTCQCQVTIIELTHVRGKRPLSSNTIGGHTLRAAAVQTLFPNFQPDDRILVEIKRAEDKEKKDCKMLRVMSPGFIIVP